MPRNMSFSMTTEAVRNRTKTVTRRLGWEDLQPGTVLWAVEKGMGLKKGEKVKRICLILVVGVNREPLHWVLDYYGPEETQREGFPELTTREFQQMFMKANHCWEYTPVNRIEFEYVDVLRT